MKPTASEIKELLKGRHFLLRRMSPFSFEIVEQIGDALSPVWSVLLKAKNLETGKEKLWIVSPHDGTVLDLRKVPDRFNPWVARKE